MPSYCKTPLKKILEDKEKAIYIKDETKQITGAFKYRGVYHKINQTDYFGYKGIITASTGNHGAAVALVSKERNIPCIVVVPENTPDCKTKNILSQSARIVSKGFTSYEQCKQYAIALSEKNRLLYISSFDDDLIIDGHKTLFAESTEQIQFDYCFCPVGGGGLVSAAIRHQKGLGKIIGVEWEKYPVMKKSLEEGRRLMLSCEDDFENICEGIVVSQVGKLPFEQAMEYGLQIQSVSYNEIVNAISLLKQYGIESEGAGAAALAAALSAAVSGKILCVVSGGNIDQNLLEKIAERENI